MVMVLVCGCAGVIVGFGCFLVCGEWSYKEFELVELQGLQMKEHDCKSIYINFSIEVNHCRNRTKLSISL